MGLGDGMHLVSYGPNPMGSQIDSGTALMILDPLLSFLKSSRVFFSAGSTGCHRNLL